MEDVARQLSRFIIENFLFGETPADFDEDTSFLESRIIDSTGVLELVDFLEATFDIEVLGEELDPENLDSISRLVAFIARKRGAV